MKQGGKIRVKEIENWSQEFTRIINGRLVIYWRGIRKPQKMYFSTIPKTWEEIEEGRE